MVDSVETGECTKKLSKRDILKAYRNWIFFAESNYNYERLQATAFAHSMAPVIEKLYTTKEEKADALKRHLSFFNTEPVCGSVIHGITIAMEEQKSNGEPITGEGINAIKSGLMGPLAGIGDTLTQGVITPILLSLCISLTMQGNIGGPIVFLIAQYLIMFTLSYSLWMNGYKYGKIAVEEILSGGIINKVIEGASIIGTLVMGGLVGDFVSLSTSIEFKVGEGIFSLQQDLFDQILPGLLPLILTLIVLKSLKKGTPPLKIMGWIIIIGAIGGIVGIF
ncbi:PTS system mannose/fructose/sorbose family transporter subunit IID [Clostridium sp. Cult3]|uniref:PTS system mannose/fructose/sorbose family transporter subunit IID n=1 Tax=Clostridium sp. Cult3 TaxID=2079004 RepID=UPI001F25AEA8|nr:PTS system mannose/fructose/sorbose family transporter subunit IID [Clostridium sp. Cult3]MCF6460417.1 PTS N-acetylglucosamine transporter subunit IIABC [Clostridium sp. Cult3]